MVEGGFGVEWYIRAPAHRHGHLLWLAFLIIRGQGGYPEAGIDVFVALSVSPHSFPTFFFYSFYYMVLRQRRNLFGVGNTNAHFIPQAEFYTQYSR